MLLLLLVAASAPVTIAPVPPGVRERFSLAPHYTKYVDAYGLPVLGSSTVADAALREARYIATSMLVNHREYFATMGAAHIRLAVMAPTELTTDLPEHSDLTPKAYWDRRARGLGATAQRPAVSCAEENLLEEPGDPYAAENICVHEFSHAVAQFALRRHVKDFDAKLTAAFENAKAKGIWKNTYAMTDESEYWAEAVQSWFDTNRHGDSEHGQIDTREEVKSADPQIAALITLAFGDVAWRYVRPSQRSAALRAELGAFPDPLPTFRWPATLKGDAVATVELGPVPSALPRSPATNDAVTLEIDNTGTASIMLDWVDFEGQLKRYASIEPGTRYTQQTYVGHVWLITRGDRRLGLFAAPAAAKSRVVVR